MIWFLLSSVALATVTVADNATRCLECLDVPHPGDCITTTTCTDGQTCVVEQFITSGGLVLFNSGCQSRQRCSRSRRRDIPQYSSLSKRSDIFTCDECCEGDFCNDKGCGAAAIKQPQRGALCFQCEVKDKPDTCRHLDKCDFGEVCMLTMLPNKAPDGSDLYKTACASPRVCTAYAILGRKRTTFCHVCCSDDFCNDRCEVQIARAQALPPTTTPTTTTSTTTTSTTTTTTTPKPTTTTTTTPKPTTTTTTTPKPTTTTTTTTTTTSKATTTTRKATTTRHQTLHDVCDHRHYHYNDHSHLCYKLHYEHRTWDDANDMCKHEGGTLAIINTQLKWDFLKNALKHDSKYAHAHENRLFIGGKYTGHNNVFKWVDGGTVHFAEWAQGQPDGSHNKCIYLRQDQDYQWHDSSCDDHYMFVCSIQI